jgi:hypothetical protein
MRLTDDIINGLGVAFNEADVLGVEFDRKRNLIGCTFRPVTLDKDGNVPDDRRVQIILKPVGRIIASLRLGNWDNQEAEVEKFEPEHLLEKVQSFGGLPIYGWEFFNCGEKGFENWKNRLSFDWTSTINTGLTNTFDIFQEGHERHLDIRIWFDELLIFNAKNEQIEVSDFIASGQRGWDAIYAGNPKTNDLGIIPMNGDTKLSIE